MADINTKYPEYLIPAAEVTVSTKDHLLVATAWTEQPHLRCHRLTRTVNGLDTATFSFQAGTNVRQIGATTMGNAAELSLRGKFVRVEFTDPDNGDFEWTGYFAEDRSQREIENPQRMTAYGLEYFLDRRDILATIVEDGKRLGRVVPFNDPSGAGGLAVSSRGNRSTAEQSAGVYEFADAENDRDEWRARDIVFYLLEHFPPQNNLDQPRPCDWAAVVGLKLDDYIVGFDPAGLTIYQILNRLVNPRRSLCWWLDYSEAEGDRGTATVRVESLNQASVTLPGGGTLPANSDQVTLNFDDDLSVASHQVETLSQGNYKAVRTRGARITTTASLVWGYGLGIDWKGATETAYKNGAKPAAAGAELDAYNALDEDEQASRNDAARRAEAFYRVYAAYRIPANWNGQTASQKCFPDNLIGGDGSANATFHANWLRILPRTLLARGGDYETVASVTTASPDGSGDDLLPPAAIIRVASSPSRYQYCDKLATADYAEGTAESADIRTAYSLMVQQDCPGVLLRPANGLNHMLALNQWTSAEPTGKDPELDYQNLIVTCSFEWDHHAEGLYPETADSGQYEELSIDVGDQYRLDYLVPGTIVDIENGTPVVTDGGLIRDDRDQLQDIARFAYEWYGAPRQTLTCTWLQVRNWFALGQMITTLGDSDPSTLNTVLGQIEFDFDLLSTSIRTIGDSLEVREVI